MLHRRFGLRSGWREPDQHVPELRARREHNSLDGCSRRNGVRRRSDLLRGRLRDRVRYRRERPPIRGRESGERLPDVPAGHEHDELDRHWEWHHLRPRRGLQRHDVRRGLLRERSLLCVRGREPGEYLRALPAGNDDLPVDRLERSELRRRRRLQRRHLHRGLRHWRSGLRLGRGEPRECVRDLSVNDERNCMDQPRQRCELRSERVLHCRNLRTGVLDRWRHVRVGRTKPGQRLPELSALGQPIVLHEQRHGNELRARRRVQRWRLQRDVRLHRGAAELRRARRGHAADHPRVRSRRWKQQRRPEPPRHRRIAVGHDQCERRRDARALRGGRGCWAEHGRCLPPRVPLHARCRRLQRWGLRWILALLFRRRRRRRVRRAPRGKRAGQPNPRGCGRRRRRRRRRRLGWGRGFHYRRERHGRRDRRDWRWRRYAERRRRGGHSSALPESVAQAATMRRTTMLGAAEAAVTTAVAAVPRASPAGAAEVAPRTP